MPHIGASTSAPHCCEIRRNLLLRLPGSFPARKFPGGVVRRSPPWGQLPITGQPKAVVSFATFGFPGGCRLPDLLPHSAQPFAGSHRPSPGVRPISVQSSSTNSKSGCLGSPPFPAVRRTACSAALHPLADRESSQASRKAPAADSDRGSVQLPDQLPGTVPPTGLCSLSPVRQPDRAIPPPPLRQFS